MSKKAKRLVDPQPKRRFLTWTRVVRYGVQSFGRNIWLTIATTLVMVITLLIIFVTFIASAALSETIASQEAKMDLSYYIKYNASDDVLRNLAGKLRVADPNVTDVTISTSYQEYQKAAEDNVEAWATAISEGGEPHLPAVIHVKLEDIDQRDKIDKFVKNDPQFKEWLDTSVTSSSDIEARQKTIDRLGDIMAYARRAGLIAGGIFVVISVLIIFNTIRMTIFSRRSEVEMMKSIGADNYFIRGPFLIEAEMYGIIAAIIAMILGYIILIKVLPSLNQYIEVAQTEAMVKAWWPLILLAMMAIGFLLGNVSARLALRKYLKETY